MVLYEGLKHLRIWYLSDGNRILSEKGHPACWLQEGCLWSKSGLKKPVILQQVALGSRELEAQFREFPSGAQW